MDDMHMMNKVLIANRGEIAVRIIRTCKRMGIKTVAIYSDADKDALHCMLADEAFRVGASPAKESYLNIDAIIGIAKKSGAEAIHPGYGFLAENSNFAKACKDEGITFVGPSSETLVTTGNKVECKRLANSQNVPAIPGTINPVESMEEAIDKANELGYPVLLKSAFGGGGLGIREVDSDEDVKLNWSRAVGEANSAFGRAAIYVEKLIRPARHIEVQILSDGKGKIIHLGERECSIQRRHQKLIEITPSPAVDEEMRERVGLYAIKVARAVGYKNSGTVEFLLDSDRNFYFMEVNSRLQVEHPITEEVTGVDLVEEQLRIAAGESLSLSQNEVRRNGAAIECRINAEDPLQNFAPNSGIIHDIHLPGGPGIRVDTAIYSGWSVPEYYDSLIAKLIAWGKDVDEARRRMSVALEEFSVKGLRTTLPFHKEVINSSSFASWQLSTDFIEKNRIIEMMVEKGNRERREKAAVAAAIAAMITAKGIHRITELEDYAIRNRQEVQRYYDLL